MSNATGPVAFTETILPTAVSASYRLGLALVTVAMILVPLLYLMLIGAVAWFLHWHLTANTWILDGDGGAQWRLLTYLTPAVAGATLLFFMVKPILARRARRGEPLQITEAEQPALHALIREICRQVRAPVPARVQVDCQVNASASVRGGIFGIFGRELDLTIGLPLVTGLSVREFSGVLAHEFGHFAQGSGLRMTVLIRTVNAWLFRVVHERDAWDHKLEEWSKDGDWRVILPMSLARLSVWVSRRALAAVTIVGHGVSCYMLRQMEFDADSYEVKIAGTNAFTRTMVRLRELSAATQMAYGSLQHSVGARRIPADLPQLFAEYSRRLPDDVREQAHRAPDDRTGRFDTHPSDADRIAAAESMAASGVLIGGDDTATILFREFDRLSAGVTRHHYENDLGLALDDIRLVTVDEALRGAEDQQRTEAAVRGFFAGRVSVLRPLRIPVDVDVADEIAEIERAFAELRDAMKRSGVSERTYGGFEHYQARRDLAFCAEQLFVAGMPSVDAERFSLAEPTHAGALSIQSWALEEQQKLGAELDPFDALTARRLALGAEVCDRRQRTGRARELRLAVNALAEAVPFAAEARRFAMAMRVLEDATPVLGTSPHLRKQMAGLATAVENCRTRAFSILAKAPIPAGDPGDDWRRLLSAAPNLTPPDALQRVLKLYWDCLSDLARLADDAEASRWE